MGMVTISTMVSTATTSIPSMNRKGAQVKLAPQLCLLALLFYLFVYVIAFAKEDLKVLMTKAQTLKLLTEFPSMMPFSKIQFKQISTVNRLTNLM